MFTFNPMFKDLIISGHKTETRRLGKKKPGVGRIYLVTTNRFDPKNIFGKIQIKSVREERISDIDEEGVSREGFDSKKAFLDTFYLLNRRKLPELGWKNEYCTVIRFEFLGGLP